MSGFSLNLGAKVKAKTGDGGAVKRGNEAGAGTGGSGGGGEGKRRRWGEAAPATAAPVAVEAAPAANPLENLSRADRLKLWKAQQAAKAMTGSGEVGAASALAIEKAAQPGGSGEGTPAPAAQSTATATAQPTLVAAAAAEEEVDPFDSFMSSIEGQVVQQTDTAPTPRQPKRPLGVKPQVITMEDILAGNLPGGQGDGDEEDDEYSIFSANPATRPAPAPAPSSDVTMDAAPPPAAPAPSPAVPATEATVKKEGLKAPAPAPAPMAPTASGNVTGEVLSDEGEDDIFAKPQEETEKGALEILNEKMAKKDLKPVDHSKIDYAPFRKDFYIESDDIKAMTPEAVKELRESMEIAIRGKRCPAPMSNWVNCGLSDKLLHILKKNGYTAPFAIQRQVRHPSPYRPAFPFMCVCVCMCVQAIPAIMSGRDVIGVAKTGSGKTLAYLLPLFRHIMDQPPLRDGEGPIGLIMAPARELAIQVTLPLPVC